MVEVEAMEICVWGEATEIGDEEEVTITDPDDVRLTREEEEDDLDRKCRAMSIFTASMASLSDRTGIGTNKEPLRMLTRISRMSGSL